MVVPTETFNKSLDPVRENVLEKPQTVQPFKKYPTFYRTCRFITVLTTAFHWSLS
jgi:hypothetical protein